MEERQIWLTVLVEAVKTLYAIVPPILDERRRKRESEKNVVTTSKQFSEAVKEADIQLDGFDALERKIDQDRIHTLVKEIIPKLWRTFNDYEALAAGSLGGGTEQSIFLKQKREDMVKEINKYRLEVKTLVEKYSGYSLDVPGIDL